MGGRWVRDGTGESVPEEAQNWASMEPDNIPDQDCVEIYIKRETDKAKWNNENCNRKKGTVCYTGKTQPFIDFCWTIAAYVDLNSVCTQPLVHRIPAVPTQTVWRP